MTRTRHCLSYHGEGCKGEKKQERKCPNMCPQSKTTFFNIFMCLIFWDGISKIMITFE